MGIHQFIECLTGRRQHDEEGASAVEYGIMVALIAAVIVAIVAVLGSQLSEAFMTVCQQLVSTAPVVQTACP